MQTVICAIKNCGYCSSSGFCLNRLVSINAQGGCSYLQKQGWNQQVDKKYKSNYNPWEEIGQEEEEEERVTLSELLESRPPVNDGEEPGEVEENSQKKEDEDQNESGKDQPPRD